MNSHQYNMKARALEPTRMYCSIIEDDVSVLLEYLDYKNRNNKGSVGTVYCENIIDCYHKGRKCKYSGISPSYPDPLSPVKEERRELGDTSAEE